MWIETTEDWNGNDFVIYKKGGILYGEWKLSEEF